MPKRTTTRSTCTAVTEQATHVFEVSGYSLHKGMGTHAGVSSGTFSVGGHSWAIRFYPDAGPCTTDEGADSDGDAAAHAQHHRYISVYLVLLSKGATARARCDLGLVDHDTGAPSSVHRTAAAPWQFRYGDASMYFPPHAFMDRAEIEASPYLRDDRLTIQCDVTVVKEPRVFTNELAGALEAPPPNIAQHLGALLETGDGADVALAVDGETFAAHRDILAARSPVFRAELLGPTREAREERVAVEDMRADVFRALLHFIYTDSLPDDTAGDLRSDAGADNNLIQHLLVAADPYGVDRLKLVCQSILCDGLGVDNVASTLSLAYHHNCPRLKNVCLELISRPNVMNAVKETSGYKDVKRKCPYIFADAFEMKACKMRRR